MSELHQISREDWNEIANSEMLCGLPYSVLELEHIINYKLFQYNEEGLGQLYGIYLVIKHFGFFLRGLSPKKDKTHGILVYIRSYEPSPLKALRVICEYFKLTKEELSWITDKNFNFRWQLYTTDENHNEIEIHQFLNESSAISLYRYYKKNNYKQKYFIKVLEGFKT